MPTYNKNQACINSEHRLNDETRPVTERRPGPSGLPSRWPSHWLGIASTADVLAGRTTRRIGHSVGSIEEFSSRLPYMIGESSVTRMRPAASLIRDLVCPDQAIALLGFKRPDLFSAQITTALGTESLCCLREIAVEVGDSGLSGCLASAPSSYFKVWAPSAGL